jgi:hypothetical protein
VKFDINVQPAATTRQGKTLAVLLPVDRDRSKEKALTLGALCPIKLNPIRISSSVPVFRRGHFPSLQLVVVELCTPLNG